MAAWLGLATSVFVAKYANANLALMLFQHLWTDLMEIFRTVLNNITDETMADWEQCLSGATNKADPNRFENSGLETVLPDTALKSYQNIVIT